MCNLITPLHRMQANETIGQQKETLIHIQVKKEQHFEGKMKVKIIEIICFTIGPFLTAFGFLGWDVVPILPSRP